MKYENIGINNQKKCNVCRVALLQKCLSHLYNFISFESQIFSLFLDLQSRPGEDQCSILMQTPVAEKTVE